MLRSLGFLVGLAVLAAVSGCDSTNAPVRSHGGEVQDHVSFVDALRARGYTVEIEGSISQPFLSVEGVRLSIRGEELPAAEIQSFNYENPSVAKADAAKIDPSGTPKTMTIRWTAPPHFYAKERVIVLYVGDNPLVTDLLSELLGPQFAGR